METETGTTVPTGTGEGTRQRVPFTSRFIGTSLVLYGLLGFAFADRIVEAGLAWFTGGLGASSEYGSN